MSIAWLKEFHNINRLLCKRFTFRNIYSMKMACFSRVMGDAVVDLMVVVEAVLVVVVVMVEALELIMVEIELPIVM